MGARVPINLIKPVSTPSFVGVDPLGRHRTVTTPLPVMVVAMARSLRAAAVVSIVGLSGLVQQERMKHI